MSEQDELRSLIASTIKEGRTRKDGIENAIIIAKTLLANLEVNYNTIERKECALTTKKNAFMQKAQLTESEEDIIAASIAQYEYEQQMRMKLTMTMSYSLIIDELNKLQHIETIRIMPIIAPHISLDEILYDMLHIVAEFTRLWHGVGDSSQPPTDHITFVSGRALHLQYCTIRGDGACGWRAYICGIFKLIHGKPLSYDPVGMAEYIIPQVKRKMLQLIRILEPTNHAFIASLYDGKHTFDTYSQMVMNPTYHATNYELRLLCVLFSMVDPRFAQVNIIRRQPLFEEIYQSISASGRIAPVTNNQITLLGGDGHFDCIINLQEGILPRLYQIEDGLIL